MSAEKKYRQFWINPECDPREQDGISLEQKNGSAWKHVIEYSALVALRDVVRKAMNRTAHMQSKHAGELNRLLANALDETSFPGEYE